MTVTADFATPGPRRPVPAALPLQPACGAAADDDPDLLSARFNVSEDSGKLDWIYQGPILFYSAAF